MTTGSVDPALVLAALRVTLLRRRAGARDRASAYRSKGGMASSAHFADGQALAYDQAIRALDDAIGALDDPKEVMKLNGS